MAAARPPLDGVRVIDFSQVAAGPYLGSLLGDMGADVIKVEPLNGDSIRGIDDAFGHRRSSYFFGVNRSKRDMTIDLGAPGARDVVDRLAGTADVLMVGMRPSAIERSGLAYERLAALNQRLIYVSITAFGETGPRSEEPGMDILAQALSGIMGLTGEPVGPPVRVGPPITDVSTAFLGGFAICAALLARDRDGLGQRISLNLLDSAVASLPNYATQHTCARASQSSRRAARTRRSCRTRSSRRPTATSWWRASATVSGRRCARPSNAPTCSRMRTTRAT